MTVSSGFSIDGVADFVQNDVVGNAGTMLGYISDAMKVVDSAVSDAAGLLQGISRYFCRRHRQAKFR